MKNKTLYLLMFCFLLFYLWSRLGPVIQVEPSVFKTSPLDPLIVSLAHNDGSARSYAQVLGSSHTPVLSMPEVPVCDSFVVHTMEEQVCDNGEIGMVVNTTHKQSHESYHIFIVGRFEQLKHQFDRTLNWFRDNFRKVLLAEKSQQVSQVQNGKSLTDGELREVFSLAQKEGFDLLTSLRTDLMQNIFGDDLDSDLLHARLSLRILEPLNLKPLENLALSDRRERQPALHCDFSFFTADMKLGSVKPTTIGMNIEDLLFDFYLKNTKFKNSVDRDEKVKNKMQKKFRQLVEETFTQEVEKRRRIEQISTQIFEQIEATFFHKFISISRPKSPPPSFQHKASYGPGYNCTDREVREIQRSLRGQSLFLGPAGLYIQ